MDVIVNLVTKIYHIIMKRALPSIKMIKDRPMRKGSDFDKYMLQRECLLHVYSCTYRVQAQFHEHGLQKYILNYASGITGKLIICGCYAKNYMIIYRINCRVKYVTTIILNLSVGVRKRQVAILALSSR